MFIYAVAVQATSLSLRNMFADMPHDVPAIVVYVMLIASVALIWRANRQKPKA